MNVYPPEDPRFQDRFAAAIELLRIWRALAIESNGGVPRYNIAPGAALNQLVEWTDDFLDHPTTPTVRKAM